jgi:hypothetical protein
MQTDAHELKTGGKIGLIGHSSEMALPSIIGHSSDGKIGLI